MLDDGSTQDDDESDEAYLDRILGEVLAAPGQGHIASAPHAETRATQAPATQPNIADVRAGYTFPLVAQTGRFSAEPLVTLTRTCQKIARLPNCEADRFALRDAWLGTNVQLNVDGLLAPRFRPQVAGTAKPKSGWEVTSSLDRQVIDLHWLHCRRIRSPIAQAEFADLLQADEFDWDAAEAFAIYRAGYGVKVTNWLALGEFDAWQLATLQTPAMRDRFGVIMRGDRGTWGAGKVRGLLMSVHANKSPDAREVRVTSDLTHWMVDKMLGAAPARAQAALYGLVLGEPHVTPPNIFARQHSAALKRIANHRRDSTDAVPDQSDGIVGPSIH